MNEEFKMKVTKYRPSSDRGSTRRCDVCECDLMGGDYVYQIEIARMYMQMCEKCFDRYVTLDPDTEIE